MPWTPLRQPEGEQKAEQPADTGRERVLRTERRSVLPDPLPEAAREQSVPSAAVRGIRQESEQTGRNLASRMG